MSRLGQVRERLRQNIVVNEPFSPARATRIAQLALDWFIEVRREVAYVIVSPAHEVGDETGRSVGRSLPVHASSATTSFEATGTKYRAFGPRRLPRGKDVTCQRQRGWGARLGGMVNRSELLQASLQ